MTNLTNKRILITGADGMIGSRVLSYLLENTDHEFVCVCSWSRKGEPHRVLQAIKGAEYRVQVITHDLSVPFTDKQKKAIGEVDYILNIASDSHVDRSIEEPVDFVQNNVNLALTMLELAREKEPKLFLQFSTDEVKGAAFHGVDHKEWDVNIPSNPYAASKSAQEDIAIAYWRTYSVPVVITNTMNVFGAGQDKEKFIPMCIDKIRRGETVTIHGNEDYIGSRSYIHVDNIAAVLLFLMGEVSPAHYSDGGSVDRPDRFNIVGEKELNNLEVAQKIADILGEKLNYELVDFHHGRPGHDRRYSLDGSKLRELGWEHPDSFDESLEKTVHEVVAYEDKNK